MSWRDVVGGFGTLRAGHSESARFGVSMSRLSIGTNWANSFSSLEQVYSTLESELFTATDDVVIVRTPSELVRAGSSIARSGRVPLAAGNLMYWESVTDRHVSLPRPPGVRVVSLGEASSSDLVDVISDSFDGYISHYSHNSLLDPEQIAAGYVEWAEHSVANAAENGLVLVEEGAPIGVATVTHHDELGALEIELAGIIRARQGLGLYRFLLDAVFNRAREVSATRVVISTQSYNTNVQRAWARSGFVPVASVDTFHALSPEAAARAPAHPFSR